VTGIHACTLCPWATAEPITVIAEARAVWHTYREHPLVWLALAGDRAPLGPDPDTPDGYALLATAAETN
jgi:hypothetical protein